MDQDDVVMVLDENGNEVEANILNIVEIDGNEYLLYSVSRNDDEEAIYVNKIVLDENGEEDIASIDDEDEKKNVYDVLRNVIEDIDQ